MREDVNIVLADRVMLLKYEEDIKSLMEYSYKINFNNCEKTSVAEEKYTKLIKYFEEGSANIVIAFENGIFAGYAWFFQKTYDRIHLNEIAVVEKFQIQGIGKKLIKFIESYAKENLISTIELFCIESNRRAGLFYKHMGYETEKRVLTKRILERHIVNE